MAKIILMCIVFISPNLVWGQLDTLEIIESDTSIVYIIEDAPVTIRDTVSYYIQPPKLYTRIGSFASILQNGFTYKEVKGKEAYFQENEKYLSNVVSYSIGMFVWNCPKRFAKGVGINLIKLRQKFSVKDAASTEAFSITNVTSLIHFQAHFGYKFSWKKRWNIIPEVSPGVQYNLSITGYVVNPQNFNESLQVQITYFAKKLSPMVSFNLRSIYSIGGIEIDLVPYVNIMPLNILKDAPVKYNGYTTGFRIGLSHKLF